MGGAFWCKWELIGLKLLRAVNLDTQNLLLYMLSETGFRKGPRFLEKDNAS